VDCGGRGVVLGEKSAAHGISNKDRKRRDEVLGQGQ
jgi:hypothetical protein